MVVAFELDPRHIDDFLQRKNLMKPKYIVFIIALGGAVTSCGGGGAPEVNSTNCSGAGMQAVLPTFDNEAERQAFIDKCQSMAEK
ncbi:MAG TPA: entry exclusion lipoprotein TrbK [Nitrosospira sp.]|nr:entry exclusion lipoprotein TrbK [Nitrosospira sp.]